MNYRREHMDLNELGRLFGVSGRQIGSRLKELGLRDRFGNPSTQAENQRLIDYDYERHGTYTKLWHVERTVKILQDAGLEPASPAPTDLIDPPELTGPFSVKELDCDQWQLVGGDGEVAIFVIGEINALVLQRVLNIAHKAEMFDTIRAQTK